MKYLTCAGWVIAGMIGLLFFTGCSHDVDNAIVPRGAKLELLHTRQVTLNSGLCEGPALSPDGSIYFTDMPFGKDDGLIMRFDPRTGKTSIFTAASGKSNGLAFDLDGNLISCQGADGGGRSVRKWDLKTGQSTVLADRFDGKLLNSPNDLCVDSKGRIYFTDPRYGGTEPRELSSEAVYRIEKDGTVIEITHDVEKPNGICLSPDGRTMYVADHNNGGNRLSPTDPEPKRGSMKIYAFPLDEDGKVAGPRCVLWDFGKENGSDGMRVDSQGNLYVACRSLAKPGIMVLDTTYAIQYLIRNKKEPLGRKLPQDMTEDDIEAVDARFRVLKNEYRTLSDQLEKLQLRGLGPNHSRVIEARAHLESKGKDVARYAADYRHAADYRSKMAEKPNSKDSDLVTGSELAFIPTGKGGQSGLFEDWRGIPSNVEFGAGEDSNVLYVTIDKSLYRIRLKTHGFHVKRAG